MPSQLPFRCFRCNKNFRSHSAKQQHIRDSAHHYLCHICPLDYGTQNDLNNHLENEHHICTTCDLRQFRTARQLQQHDVDKHNMCIICGKYYGTPQNLKMHKLIHAEKNIECAGCSRLFVTESAMLLHLEAGTCESGTDRNDVIRLGRQCYTSGEYWSVTPGYNFQCPTCHNDFRLMSSLVQHVESDMCDENLDYDAPLRDFLEYVWSSLR
ncbi:hypothetical protein FPOAC1_012639 [Fusarium poae]|jgi:DNA-directed RNA polymerase subunit RPC12/RpoP|uniref:hypothetical protein n=1 Tax=Fusarium poae TaxID=36050 RepID=UPI001CEBCBB3|nr:hypothetical protein FPOAC1_012639 [Fusarium poae]KAG8667800.1 hypothetical protein FPOAC1_012639 [Fusarium poae]